MTTDQMDGLFTQQDLADRYNVYVQCRACNKWSYLKCTAETYINPTRDRECTHCSSTNFDLHSVTSKRTWNPLNKRKVKV